MDNDLLECTVCRTSRCLTPAQMKNVKPGTFKCTDVYPKEGCRRVKDNYDAVPKTLQNTALDLSLDIAKTCFARLRSKFPRVQDSSFVFEHALNPDMTENLKDKSVEDVFKMLKRVKEDLKTKFRNAKNWPDIGCVVDENEVECEPELNPSYLIWYITELDQNILWDSIEAEENMHETELLFSSIVAPASQAEAPKESEVTADKPKESKESKDKTKESKDKTKESKDKTKESKDKPKESKESKDKTKETKESKDKPKETKESKDKTKESKGKSKTTAEPEDAIIDQDCEAIKLAVQEEAEEKAKKEAEAKAKKEAEAKAKKEAEAKAKKEAEDKAKKEAEDKAKKEAEAKAKKEAEDKAKKEAEDKAKKEAEDKAKKEAEDKAKKSNQRKRVRESKADVEDKKSFDNEKEDIERAAKDGMETERAAKDGKEIERAAKDGKETERAAKDGKDGKDGKLAPVPRREWVANPKFDRSAYLAYDSKFNKKPRTEPAAQDDELAICKAIMEAQQEVIAAQDKLNKLYQQHAALAHRKSLPTTPK